MGTPNSLSITIVVISGVMSVLLGLYAYARRSDFSGMRPFLYQSLASSIYIFGYAFELAAGSLEEIKRWIAVEYAGMPFIAPLSLMLVLHYVGLDGWLTRLRTALLLVVPALTFALATTNDAHGLFYREVFLRPGMDTPSADMLIGPWYVVHGAYTFGCLAAGLFLLMRQWPRTPRHYRPQLATMIIGPLLPCAASFLYLAGQTPGGMDPVPLVLSVTYALYLRAILSNGLLSVVPIAKESLFESMQDGVLVLDLSGRLVDCNRAAAGMIPSLSPAAIGRPIGGLGVPGLTHGGEADGDGDREVRLDRGDQAAYYQVRSTPVRKASGRIAGRMIVLRDVTEERRLRDELQRMAYYDGLTRIYNRTRLLELVELLLEECRTEERTASLVLLDLDRFKLINDQYGHDTGDAALRHIVSVCSGMLGPEDLFGRYGGEEFALCLPGADLAQAAEIAERIRTEIARTPLQTPAGRLDLTASFGAAEARPDLPVEDALRRADQALYAAKRAGRNRVYVADGPHVRPGVPPSVVG